MSPPSTTDLPDRPLPGTRRSATIGLPLPAGSNLGFRRLADGPFGVEVTGLVWGRSDPETVRLLSAALRSHLLLVLRGQNSPSEAELDQFLRSFGRLVLETEDGREHYKGHLRLSEAGPASDLKREMRAYQHRAGDNTGSTYYDPAATVASELVWHNDQSHRPMLKVISVLEAVDFDEVTVPTQFRDTYVAAETLTPETRSTLAWRQAIYFDPRLPPPSELPRTCDAMHPVVVSHPHSGRRALYVNDYADRVAGMDRAESDELLGRLRLHLDTHAPLYEHQWRTGDIVVWDNLGVQHRRDPVPTGQRRRMRQHGGVAE
jgi:alpha-ketoglutarate-dependent taurine dioxygenase